MAELTHERKLRVAVSEHPTKESILRLLEYENAEAVSRLKKIKDSSDFRYLQGEINAIERYIELLSK